MPYMPKHALGWEDDGYASLRRCGNQDVRDCMLNSEAEPVQCPICGEFIKLVWHVYVEEVTPLPDTPKQT
jgi:hypothetical protein